MNNARILLSSRVHPLVKKVQKKQPATVLHEHVHSHGQTTHNHVHPHTNGNLNDHNHN